MARGKTEADAGSHLEPAALHGARLVTNTYMPNAIAEVAASLRERASRVQELRDEALDSMGNWKMRAPDYQYDNPEQLIDAVNNRRHLFEKAQRSYRLKGEMPWPDKELSSREMEDAMVRDTWQRYSLYEPEDLEVICNYQGAVAYGLNKALRRAASGQDAYLSDYEAYMVPHLDNLFETSAPRSPRAVKVRRWVKDPEEIFGSIQEGAEIKEAGYLSTTAHEIPDDHKTECWMEITVPEGTPYMAMNAVTQVDSFADPKDATALSGEYPEREILFGRGHKLRITEVDKFPSGQYKLKCELVPDSPQDVSSLLDKASRVEFHDSDASWHKQDLGEKRQKAWQEAYKQSPLAKANLRAAWHRNSLLESGDRALV